MDGNGLSHEFKPGHYVRTGQFIGDKNPRFNNDTCRTQNGYILKRNKSHRFADNRGYIPEHHLVWEKHNKAILLPNGVVHHINHIRDDNRIENLMAMTKLMHDTMEHYLRKRDNLGRFI